MLSKTKVALSAQSQQRLRGIGRDLPPECLGACHAEQSE
jgi:hypothetical protein